MKTTHVIPLEPDFDEAEVEYVRHRRTETDANGVEESTELRVPRLGDGATPYAILTFLSLFARARNTLSWTTGPKLFAKFSSHLDGYPMAVWELAADGVNHTVINFDNTLRTFKADLLAGYHYVDQIDFLRALKKPTNMTPAQFLLCLRSASRMAAQLPDAPDDGGFDEAELARVFVKAMPQAFQTNFENANLSYSATPIAEIREYMDKQAVRNPPSNQGQGQGNNRTQQQGGRNGGNLNGNGGRGGRSN